MKFDECAKRLADHGYELIGSSSEGLMMSNGIVKVTFYNTKTGYRDSTDTVQRMYTYMGLSGEWDYRARDYLAQDENNTLIPGCPQVSIDEQVRILTGSPTEIVKKFRDLYMESMLDKVLV